VVAIHPPLVEFLTSERAEQLVREERFADEPEGMATAWRRNLASWADTVARARRLPEPRLHERVSGEWSFTETLRHLVFVTDAWVRDVVEEAPSPYHPWGMPPTFLAAEGAALGIAAGADPSLDEVLEVRADRMTQAERAFQDLTPEALARRCAPREGRFTVAGALQTLLFEEWAHERYATRDLAGLGH
jgi:DinB superfamily